MSNLVRGALVRRRWTFGRVVLALFGAVVVLRWTAGLLLDWSVDPQMHPLAAGEYQVRRVTEDGLLELARPERPFEVLTRLRLSGVRSFGRESDVDSTRLDPAAVDWLREAVGGRAVEVEFDRRRFDADGRWLGYVRRRSTLINAELLRSGTARRSDEPGGSAALQRRLRQAESEARRAGRGGWSGGGPQLVPPGPPD